MDRTCLLLTGGWMGMMSSYSNLPPEFKDYVTLIQDNRRHCDLFSRASAVLHHGGAGTAGAALLAGVPQIVCPRHHDQLQWVGCCTLTKAHLQIKFTPIVQFWRWPSGKKNVDQDLHKNLQRSSLDWFTFTYLVSCAESWVCSSYNWFAKQRYYEKTLLCDLWVSLYLCRQIG